MDSSALIAVLNNEPDAERFAAALLSGDPILGAPTLLEASIVARPERLAALDTLVRRTLTEVVAFTEEHARIARAAYARYGRGSGSPAALNLGDCMSYALAQVRDEPLLFKGHDFTHTDVTPAL
ncbi:type II toxin-antitoxin system VapC family toxin [Nocardioides hungaricus]